jgi:hypothetical protein
MAVILQHPRQLRFVYKQTKALRLAAVSVDGFAIQHVRGRWSNELMLAAVRQNGLVLDRIRKQTPEICLAAVQQNGEALRFVREQTEELCLAAIANPPHYPVYSICSHIEVWTEAVCLAVLRAGAGSVAAMMARGVLGHYCSRFVRWVQQDCPAMYGPWVELAVSPKRQSICGPRSVKSRRRLV